MENQTTRRWPSGGGGCLSRPFSVIFMDTNTSTAGTAEELEAAWRTREAVWRRKLGRLRLGVEPIEEQLARYRRVTWR